MGRVTLRPLELRDIPRLLEIGTEPDVARWWTSVNEETLRAKAEGRDEATAFAIEDEGDVVGLVQYWEENDPEYRHAGIDIFLTTARAGRGLGTEAVRTLARHLIDDRGHHRITIDPAAANAPAIRCYEKVGFKRVGVLRQYWRDPAGVWHDGLLMDLLADELTR